MRERSKLLFYNIIIVILAFALFFGARWIVGRFAPAFVQQKVEEFKEETFGEGSLYYLTQETLFKKGAVNFTLKYLDAVAGSNIKLPTSITDLNMVVILSALPENLTVNQVVIEGDVTDIYTSYNPELLEKFYNNLLGSGKFSSVEKYDSLSLIKITVRQ